ncbi:hypothetical protein SAMN04487939_101988 [Lysobacter sp. yr284]|uniref:hypothetical protein n=1 Tax=Lysobacter sp. yr284 TaxID=1761791 RepID=UPI000897DF71|nr:hypothetical protein [Lysobacter sp. yr284]SDY35410.1 hypothetical protein SAMN04487939_101988 [Lysobacter sp. yr284]
MCMWIMVGLDEWIVVDGRRKREEWPVQPPLAEPVEACLATRGLSGCVGVALSWSSGHIGLAHVFSGCTDGQGLPPGPDTWNGPGGYLERLNHALDASQAAIPGAAEDRYRDAMLIYSEPTPTRTVELLQQWLRSKGFSVSPDAGQGGRDVIAGRDEDEEMSVIGDGRHAQYLISSDLRYGLHGQMTVCEALSQRAHPADR